jgi:GntR family transcriptional repressor for pyruvate dehydrogenase complex
MSYQFLGFRSVKTGKVSELIAQQIKRAILARTIRPGEKLPTEREFVERFEASRNSVREALKILEVSGMITVKRGSGIFVTWPSSEPLKESFSNLLRMQNITLNQLATARLVFEPGVARMACENATEEDLRALEENLLLASKKVDVSLSARTENIEFHYILARATHNPAIVLTMDTLYSLEKDMLREITTSAPCASVPSRHSLNYHRKILKALRERKAQEVYDLTFKHIPVVLDAVKKLEEQETKSEQQQELEK